MNIKKLILLLFSCSTLLCSCDQWLNVNPEDAISDSELYKTGFGFRNALNGIYINLAKETLYGRELTWGFTSALSGDYDQTDAVRLPPYKDAANLEYRTTQTYPVVKGIWEQGYLAIANINKLLKEIEKSKPTDFEYGQEEQDLIRCEALALRGMLHFDLLRLYAPAPAEAGETPYLPYRETYEVTPGTKLAVRPFIEKVLRDLTQAEKGIRKNDTQVHPKAMYSSAMNDVSGEWSAKYRLDSDIHIDDSGAFFWYRGYRMNILGLLAIKARVCLYAGSDFYQNAEDAAGELYDYFYREKGWIGFTPIKDLKAPLGNRYTKAGHDVLFGLSSSRLSANYTNASGVDLGSISQIRLPLAGIDELFASDNTGVYSDLRLKQLINSTNETYTQYYSLKYLKAELNNVLKMEGSLLPIIRFSEVCHILSELACRRGDLAGAKAYLETVRKARGADRSISATTQDEMMGEILTDIRKESLGEGQSFYAFKRLRLALREGVTLDKYTLPIPESEVPY